MELNKVFEQDPKGKLNLLKQSSPNIDDYASIKKEG